MELDSSTSLPTPVSRISDLVLTGSGVEIGLISFDIDGTLESGDPPGPITLPFIHSLRARGFIIGSCSDRTPREQQSIWRRLELVPDFVARKTELPSVRSQFAAHFYVHVGDTSVDESYAKQAKFEFWWPWEVQLDNPESWPTRR
jgi:hypothetical protein